MAMENKFIAGVNDELWRLPKVKEKVGGVTPLIAVYINKFHTDSEEKK